MHCVVEEGTLTVPNPCIITVTEQLGFMQLALTLVIIILSEQYFDHFCGSWVVKKKKTHSYNNYTMD